MSEQAVEREHRITPLELYFDLVFVFAFTQTTAVISEDTTWAGLGRGMLILAAVWWAWASYAWLTNTVDAGRDEVLAAVLVAMAAMFVAALAVPEAFGGHGVLFGVAFLIVAVMHLALYALSARSEPELFVAILRIAPWSLLGASLILAAGFVDDPARSVLWIAALAVGFLGPLVGDMGGWRLAPVHFVERHGLIVIIAIGESLIAIGLGARSADLGIKVIVAALLGLVVATSFWLGVLRLLPDPCAAAARRAARSRAHRPRRDAYSYLHLPMVAGIVLFAFAMEVTVEHVGGSSARFPRSPSAAAPRCISSRSSCCGCAISRRLGRGRLVAAAACMALFPVALAVPALVALTLIATVWVAFHATSSSGGTTLAPRHARQRE